MDRKTDRMCFACGEDNPISLKLNFQERSENEVEAFFIPGEEHQGYDGIMHGGLITTLLDEGMVKTLSIKEIKAVTAEIKVRFKTPVKIGQRLHIIGRLTGQKSRLYFTEGILKNEEGKTVASAEGKFMKVS